MDVLKGVGIANGIAIAKALLILDEDTVLVEETIPTQTVVDEVMRFEAAVDQAKQEITAVKNQVESRIGEEHAFIFETHLMLLEDKALKKETVNRIREHAYTADYAFYQVLIDLIRQFENLEDSYFGERSNDLKDVGRRVLKILRGGKEFGFKNLKSDVIVVGRDFGPSNITHFDNPRIQGFCSDLGGQTTHTAIIAKALDLPAVVGLHSISRKVKSGDTIIIDSFGGKVYVNPNDAVLAKYRNLMRVYAEEEANYLRDIHKPAETLDGTRVQLFANVELPGEVRGALEHGADGVGLYRTEFLYLSCDPELPSEQVHYETYAQMAKALNDRPLVIRTLDMGGEKFFHRTFEREKELNPVMGLRGIRLCLKREDIFRVQLRGMLRAAAEYPNIRIMFPLVSSLSEWRAARDVLLSVRDQMIDEGLTIHALPKLGVMIEVPSAAMIADLLAEEVDFFSIGTNDLLQYFLAIDRANDDVRYLYNPFHPGFIRMLAKVVDAANERGIEVSCCGEIAASPSYACLLIHLGIRQLSMNPSSLPIVHHMIRVLDLERLKSMVVNPVEGRSGIRTKQGYLDALRSLLSKNDFQHLVDDFSRER